MLLIMARAKYKPLSFSTTLRNPNRIAGFLNQMLPYENKILTSEVIFEIIHNVIKNKLYKTIYEIGKPEYKEIFYSDELQFTDDQVEDIIKNTNQDHKEAGFDHGWESRFQTWYILLEEFGFVFYEKNKIIKISKAGHMLIDAYNEEEVNEQKIQNILLNCMAKYRTNNPFKKNLNSNVPLLLLMKVIQLLKNDVDENNSGVYRKELSLFICWPDDDAEKLYKLIKKIRKDFGYQYGDEVIYDICLELLGCITPEEKDKNKKYFKIEKICGEAIDEYIRKMRSTGVISLRGNGRFLDLNSFEQNKIKYILDNYDVNVEIEDKEKYFNYMGLCDNKFFDIRETVDSEKEYNVKIEKLYEISKKFTKEDIFRELMILSKKLESQNDVFKYISEPTRLEFLTSISLVQNLESCYIVPNYSIDDEGLPTMTARGEMPDIVCTDSNVALTANIEVTLMKGRSDQVNNEIVPIRRHLLSKINENLDAFAVFIAPYVHEDTKEIAEWYKHKDKIDISTLTIEEFINKIKTNKKLITLNEMGGK